MKRRIEKCRLAAHPHSAIARRGPLMLLFSLIRAISQKSCCARIPSGIAHSPHAADASDTDADLPSSRGGAVGIESSHAGRTNNSDFLRNLRESPGHYFTVPCKRLGGAQEGRKPLYNPVLLGYTDASRSVGSALVQRVSTRSR